MHLEEDDAGYRSVANGGRARWGRWALDVTLQQIEMMLKWI